MVVRQKPELRNIFRTGQVPTEQDFTDFIDSYIASINGNMPNENGDVEVDIPFTVSPGIPVDGTPNLYPLGRTIGMFNYVPGENAFVDELYQRFNIPETTITVITDRFGLDGRSVIIQQVDLMQDGAFIPVLTRSSNMEQTEWGALQFISSIRSINGNSPDINGNIVLPEVQKQASVFFRRESNQTILASADTTMIFNGKDNNPISVNVDVNTGVFTLDPTKKYSFDVNPTVQFVSGAASVDYSMFSYDGQNFTQITSQRGFISNDGSTGSGSSHTGSFVVDGSVHPQVAIRAVTIGGSSETRGFGLLAIYSHVLIKEL